MKDSQPFFFSLKGSVYKYILIFFMLAALLSSAMPTHAQSDAAVKTEAATDLKGLWQYRWGDSPKDENGTPVWLFDDMNSPQWQKTNYFNQPANWERGRTIWVRIRLPEETLTDPALYFRTFDQTIELYLDGKLLYSFGEIRDFSLKGASGTHHHMVPLPVNFQGKVLYFRIFSPNLMYAGYLNKPRIGPKAQLLLHVSNYTLETVQKDIYCIILAFLFIFIGFVIMLVFFFGIKEQKPYISLGFSSICIGLWLIGDNKISLFFLDAPTVWSYIATVAIQLMPAGFCAFVEHVVGGRYSFMLRRLWQMYILYTFLTLGLDLTNTLPLMLTISLFHALLVATMFIVIAIVVKAAVDGSKEAKIIAVGFIILSLTGINDILVMFYSDLPFLSRQRLTNWGMLIFVLSLVFLLGKQFVEVHNKLKAYSKEIETKNLHLHRMWSRVKASRDQIAEWNKTLENRVAERTEQVEAANRELREALETLKNAQEHLVQSEKLAALGSLVAGIAHEINTPVGIGVTAASYLEQKTRDLMELYQTNTIKKSDLEKYMHTSIETSGMVLSNLQRASDLIRSFKQVAADQSNEEKRTFNVKKYIEEILLSLSPKLKRTKHRITITCDDSLEIYSYPGALSQIVTNLVMNSLMHAFHEEIEGSISFDIAKEGGSLLFRYSDDGRGIDRQNIGKIFDPFFTTRRGSGGTGLGLNIVYNLVTQTFGGTIKCGSEPGKGAVFIIRFPVQKGDLNG